MKGFFSILLSITCLLGLTSVAFAAPDNGQKAANNPNVVAYYTSGDHGVAGESATHTGTDLVQQAGKSGNFQQWFTGTASSPDNSPEGDHSVWKSVGDAPDCSKLGDGWVFVANANQSWGSYLQPGNYCVHTNDFASK